MHKQLPLLRTRPSRQPDCHFRGAPFQETNRGKQMAIARAPRSSRVRRRMSGKLWRRQVLQGRGIATPQNKRDRAKERAAPPVTSARKANRAASTTHSKMVDVALPNFPNFPPHLWGERGELSLLVARLL